MKKIHKNLTLDLPSDSNDTPSPVQDGNGRLRVQQNELEEKLGEGDSDDERVGIAEQKVVQFEQFNAEEFAKERQSKRNKKQFSIEIPQPKIIPFNYIRGTAGEKEGFKEPLAPSHRSESKSFVFPTVETKMPMKSVKKNSDEIEKAFQRERQEFYKEKSRYEKQIIIKDGQIQMLQNIITGKFKQNQNQCYETIILEKDLQLNQLLKKINQLNQCLAIKSEEINQIRYQLSKIQSQNMIIKNELFVYQKKKDSERLTQKFYQQKAMQVRPPTPRPLYEDKFDRFDKMDKMDKFERSQKFGSKRDDNGYSGIQDLQRRLQHLKHNRVQMQDRSRMKPQVIYSQTSKNKSGREIRAIFRDQQFKNSRY